MRDRERCLGEALTFDPRVLAKRAVIADAFEGYLAMPKRPNSNSVLCVNIMNDVVGTTALFEYGRRLSAAGDPARSGVTGASTFEVRCALPLDYAK